MKNINIRGARTHNLKNISLSIPRDKLVVITGLSGCGKSSLAFDTLYAEGQRRYVESLSAYARQFLSRLEKPDVDHIEGLSPAIAIEQKSTSHNPRSTVGTITEVYDYLRLLYARVGEPHCPEHGVALAAQTVTQMVDSVMALPADSRWLILAPVVQERKGEYRQLLEQLRAQGFVRVRIDGELYELDDVPTLTARQKHTIEVVIDRIQIQPDITQRLSESFETALRLGEGLARIAPMSAPGATPPKTKKSLLSSVFKSKESSGTQEKEGEQLFSARYACPHCGYNLSELEPRLFSFNNPAGACDTCDGLGVKSFVDRSRMVSQPQLSLSEGAIRGFSKKHAYGYHWLEGLAKYYKFSLETPFKNLSLKIQNIILDGSGKDEIPYEYQPERGPKTQRKHVFEGLVAYFTRRYRDTESNSVREDIARWFLSQQPCPDCAGSRLNKSARNVFVGDLSLPSFTELPIHRALSAIKSLSLPGHRAVVAEKIAQEISARLSFLVNVGLDYLSLDRSADTLSGGEAQRIRLASQIGAGLVGVLYILDEPSIGLHQRDNARLLATLHQLRDLGNTVLVVEHDEDAIRTADYLVDLGPGAGVHGGEVVAQGSVKDILAAPNSLTGQYLSGKREIAIPKERRKPQKNAFISIESARGHNLKNISVEIPIGVFTCITGVSGSGKSTLINDTLFPAAMKEFNGNSLHPAAAHDSIKGLEKLTNVIDIDQSPIGRTPRSNPATYTGVFTLIRDLFAETPEARARGYSAGRFSFNVKGGRCEACEGDGVIRVSMHFLPDLYVTCEVCQGKRYQRETLTVHYKGKNISDILNLTVEDALKFFEPLPPIARKLKTLCDVGLSYITLGQNATTLSGGEAQRIKLAKELSKRDTGQTLYILDEPTTGLHFHDIAQLLEVLQRLCSQGNTIVVIEHNLDVIKTADWIVDLGPEGGEGGGQLVVAGTPEKVAACKKSYTGQFLKKMLK